MMALKFRNRMLFAVAGLAGCAALAGCEKSKPAERGTSVASKTDLLVAKWRPLLVSEPGKAPSKSQLKKWSHHMEPIPDDGKLHGRSRRWGDADLGVQATVVEYIVTECRRLNLSDDVICYIVAKARTESGFNPDAAAPQSSAAGLSQCIDRTRETHLKRLKLRAGDPFDIPLNVALLICSAAESFNYAARKLGRRDGSESFYAEAYRYHHDGPETKKKNRQPKVYRGLKVANEILLPTMEVCRRCLAAH